MRNPTPVDQTEFSQCRVSALSTFAPEPDLHELPLKEKIKKIVARQRTLP
jgi:hypothetical protein